MDTFRYVLAVMLVVGLPPAIVFWLLVHPLASLWRRIGTGRSYVILTVACVLVGAAVYRFRVQVLGADLGFQWALLLPGLVLYGASAWISVLTRRRLDLKTFVGVPEISGSGERGVLLQEGVYGVVRHPRYLSVIIGTLGFAMFVNYLGAYLMVLVSTLALLLVVVLEERELQARFGDRFEEYRSRVPAFFPRLPRS